MSKRDAWRPNDEDIEWIFAIDPGKTGGMCIMRVGGVDLGGVGIHSVAISMPKTPREIGEYIRRVGVSVRRKAICLLEMQWARQTDGKGQAFRYGQHYGHLEMALDLAKIWTLPVAPSKWIPALDIGRSGDYDEHPDWKRHLKDVATQWHPELKPTLATCDAILLAEYGCLIHNRGEIPECLPTPKRRPKRRRGKSSAKPLKSATATRRRRAAD